MGVRLADIHFSQTLHKARALCTGYDQHVKIIMKLNCGLLGHRSWNRKRLFSLTNDMPTIFEVVTGRKPVKDKPSGDIGSKSRNSKRSIDGQIRTNNKVHDASYVEDEDEHSETLCGSCGGNYSANEFWIGCDICERWYHGKCVKITPAKAESIPQYKCPPCSTKKSK